MMNTSRWMAASKDMCALILELSKAARFPPYNSEVQVTPMLYADDLCLTNNQPQQLQLILDRLHVYAQRKGFTKLVMNVAKAKIVHFKLRGNNVPVITLGGARLACADSLKRLGMTHDSSDAVHKKVQPLGHC
eukprot:1146764-Pelagomonas_calceolata.AAC.1